MDELSVGLSSDESSEHPYTPADVSRHETVKVVAVRETISEAFDVKLNTSTAIAKKRRIRWDAPRELSDWVSRLSESVTKLEERVEQFLITCDKVDVAVDLLEKIDYDSKKFRQVMDSILKYIDEMSLGGYPQLAT
jgi:hypothetical protein